MGLPRLPPPDYGSPSEAFQPARRNCKLRKCSAGGWGGQAGWHKRNALLSAPDDLCEEQPCQTSSAGMHSLPPDLLIQVFSQLDPGARRLLLPLVCQQWRDVVSQPTSLWTHLDLDFASEAFDDNGQLAQVKQEQIIAWVHQRGSAVRSLRLQGSYQPLELREISDEDGASSDGAVSMTASQPLHDFTGMGLARLLLGLRLEELVLERCSDILQASAFVAIASLSNLKVLNLKGIRSQLHPSQSEALWGLGHLEELVLDCDQPQESDDAAVLPQHTADSWGLPEFPDGMLKLRNLTHLTLSCHYALTSLPSTITKLNKLQVLNLDFCTLENLPASLGNLTALTTLDVEGNLFLGDAFRQLPSTPPGMPPISPLNLSGLSSLRYLNLNACGLTQIPEMLSELHGLETLDLEDNELGLEDGSAAVMGRSLTSLSRLQCLNVAQCRLSHLPAIVERLSGLRILDLTNNRITNEGLPASLARLPHLKAIGLKKNRLTSVPRLLGGLRSLQELYLEDNEDLQVGEGLDFIAQLPALRMVMMGKTQGSWNSRSLHFMTDFGLRLHTRHPARHILRISFPGQAPDEHDDAPMLS
ncbi:hypothetical protein WJX84_010719 [Apatococcus fuscideae]|uniref:F-box domain-containing protein n=1 Tax=Apatococcus fuscideae TaxID=2026836 RepID=A0AAW1TAM4_9CHLO